jgi:hypothetical protein
VQILQASPQRGWGSSQRGDVVVAVQDAVKSHHLKPGNVGTGQGFGEPRIGLLIPIEMKLPKAREFAQAPKDVQPDVVSRPFNTLKNRLEALPALGSRNQTVY